MQHGTGQHVFGLGMGGHPKTRHINANDAHAIASRLKALGFTVVELRDGRRSEMTEALARARGHAEEGRRVTIAPDLPDFVSPIDGKWYSGRAGLREHCAKHGVTYTETSLVKSYGIVVRYLNQVGLSKRNPFDCPLVREYRA